MSWPYSWTFAALCVFQGVLVALGWRDERRLGAARVVGLLLPVAALIVGIVAIQGSDWSRTALARLATFGTPVAAALAGVMLAWRRPIVAVALSPILFLVAWRVDGLVGDGAGVVLIGLACLAIAGLIATVAPARALAAGLVVLAIVDSILVFRGHVARPTAALHAVPAPVAAGHALPALQDATFGRSLYGWLDMLAPALAGMLLVHARPERLIAAAATAATSLAWGMLLAVTDQIPGTVPPLAAVAVWMALPKDRSDRHPLAPFNPLLAQRRRRSR